MRRRLVHRDPHRDPVAHGAHALDPVHGLLDELEAGRGQRLDRVHRLVDGPGAVRVQAQLDLRADRRAHGRDAAGVVADPDLDLHAPEAVARGRGGLRGGLGAVLGRDRRVDPDLPARAPR